MGEDYRPVRPVAGRVYWAPTANSCESVPLIFGENHGVIVDGESQDVAVVYTTRELAEAALADPLRWHPNNVARVTVRPVRAVARDGWVTSRRFEWAEVAA